MGWFSSSNPFLHPDGPILLQLGSIVFYEAACAIFLPLPSELPMFLFPRLSRVTVLAACAIGKAMGAWLVFTGSRTVVQSRWASSVKRLIKFPERMSASRIYRGGIAFSEAFIRRYGLIGFAILMAVPGMPMRTPIYAFSVLRINRISYTLTVAFGTVVRNLLVYGGYLGLKSMFS